MCVGNSTNYLPDEDTRSDTPKLGERVTTLTAEKNITGSMISARYSTCSLTLRADRKR